MPRPSISRPPPLSTMPENDVENEPPTAYNVRRHGPTNRKLFFTPQSKTPSASPTHLLTRDSITRRFYKRHDDRTPVKTPLPRRPSNAPSTARRPKITTLDATPSINRTLRGAAPDRWRGRQAADLVAWLNHELSPGSDSASLPLHHLATSVVYLNQFAATNAIYRSRLVHAVLARVTNEICSGRLGVSKSIKLATFIKEREELISLLLLNYHPHWLLLALSVTLGVNLATAVDQAVESAGAGGRSFNHEQVLMQALENAIRDEFLADAPSENVSSREKVSPNGQARDRYNALILRRTLVVIYLLDVAKQQREPIIKPDPPLFRATSKMTSSVDVLKELQKFLLNDQGDIVKFLGQRGYQVSYKSPVYEPFGNLRIVNLAEDMRDGTRLCKLASIMRHDHQILTQVIRIGPGHRPSMALAIKKQNITSALNLMKECLPENLQSKFQWHATAHDIAAGNLDKTIALLWQIAALWMEYVVVDVSKLQEELGIVQNEFRVARRNPDSPSNKVQPDLIRLAHSPSKLQIIESCTTNSGDFLLKWCATLCGIYGVEIRDFTEDFRDGAVLCLILHHYCPELMRIDEINRIPAGDQRGAFAAEAEHKHVQRNLDLFMDRCRLLGTIPEIFLSSEATLAPAFRDSLKEDSVGRVMQLLTSYLFRRMMLQKQTSSARREVFEIMEKNRQAPELETTQEIDPVHERRTVLIDKQVSADVFHRENTASSQRRFSANSFDANESTTSEEGAHAASTAHNSDSEKVLHAGTGDLAHVYTRMRHVQSRRATRPRSSQLTKDRENAARVILRHYRGSKARRDYMRLREAIVDLQSSIRGFIARRETNQLRETHQEEITRHKQLENPQENLFAQATMTAEPSIAPAQKPSTTIDEDTRSLPVRIGRQILEFLPAFRRHVMTMESYSRRMLAHEHSQAENQAATVIQSAARLHFARRARSHVETQRNTTRRTWMTCAAEAAKAALQIAEERRREIIRWRENIFSNALSKAESAFNAEILKAEEARKENALHLQKVKEMKAAQEANFAQELHEQKVAFEGQLASIHREIKSLQTRATELDLSPDSHIYNEPEDIFESLAQSSVRNEAQDDAIRLILGDLNMERERADRLEKELRSIRDRENETEEDLLRINKALEDRFLDLEADIKHSSGTLLTGAICMATSQYRLHMNNLAIARREEEQVRDEWESKLRKGYAAFDEEEQEGLSLLEESLSKFDADSARLNDIVATRKAWADERDTEELRSEEYHCRLEADLDGLFVQSKKVENEWVATSKEFEAQAEGIASHIGEFERDLIDNERQNETLDAEIERLIAAERRQNIEGRLVRLLESAEERFCSEMSERCEENDNILYCRHEIDIQLEQVDQEEVLETEEFQRDMEKIESDIDILEGKCSDLDEHLGLLDSYIDYLFSESPSLMEFDDIPDIPGEQLLEDVEECVAIHAVTCQLMEELYVDESEDGRTVTGDNVHYDSSAEEASPTRPHAQFADAHNEEEDMSKEYENADINDLESIDHTASFGSSAGLYDRLVEEEVEYYNGKVTHDVGVQTGSGPDTPSASPGAGFHSEVGAQHLSDDSVSQSENESRNDDTESEFSSCEDTPCVSHSNRLGEDNDFYTAPIIYGQEEPGALSHYIAVTGPLSHLRTPEADRETVSDDTSIIEMENAYSSAGPLDTLAQLALQDALETNMLDSGFASELHAQKASEPALSPTERYVVSSGSEEKENLHGASEFYENKSSGLKVYGLRRDSQSPLQTWNSSFNEEHADEGSRTADENNQNTEYQSGSESYALDTEAPSLHADVFTGGSQEIDGAESDIPADLSDLSTELNAFNIQPHRKSVERVVEDPSSANKLASVMRRISIAASSPLKSKTKAATPEAERAPHRDIVSTIFILMRYCSRSGDQLKVRELGISILSDFCMVHQRVQEVMAAEECIDVLTTCVQYHRDQDVIFYPTVRVLWEIALQQEGKQMITENKDCVSRLRIVNEMLVSQATREQKNRERIRQANMIVEIVRKRRAEGGSLKSMNDALHTARDQRLNSELPRKDSHRLLADLVEIISK